MSNTLLSVFVTRNESHSKDDTIFVRRVDSQMIVYHTCGDSGIKSEINLTYKGLAHYVNTLCTLFVTDTVPFDSIQFNFAGFPTHMATRRSLGDKNVIQNLMSIATLVKASAFDTNADTDAEEGEVNEFAEMPPLVCGSRTCSGNSCSGNIGVGTHPCSNPCYVDAY